MALFSDDTSLNGISNVTDSSDVNPDAITKGSFVQISSLIIFIFLYKTVAKSR